MTALLEVGALRVVAPAAGAPIELLRGVSLRVAPGEVVSIVGESGSGKSLTIKAILGLLPPPLAVVGGTIVLDGHDVAASSERQRQRLRGRTVALVPQHPQSSLNPVLTVGDQFTDVLTTQGRDRAGIGDYWRARLPGRRRDELRATMTAALGAVRLPEPARVLGRYPIELSGGQCQRVLIAMALAGRPRLLLADEPGTALDATIQAQINRLLVERVRSTGAAMVYVTHDLGVARQVSDRVSVMYAGRIVEEGPTAAVFAYPRHPYTLGLLRSVPRLSGARFEGIEGAPPAPRAVPSGCAFRDRCPIAIDRCAEAPPLPVAVGEAHQAACLRVEAPAS